MEAVRRHIQEEATRLGELWTQIDDSVEADKFVRILRAYSELVARSRSVGNYANLRARGIRSADATRYRTETYEWLMHALAPTHEFGRRWRGLDESTCERLYASAGPFTYYLRRLRIGADVREEPDEGTPAVDEYYAAINNLSDQYQTVMSAQPNVSEWHHEKASRIAAYAGRHEFLEGHREELGALFYQVVGAWERAYISVELPGNILSGANAQNDLDDSVVDAMLQACRQNVHLYRRMCSLLGRRLGEGRPNLADLTAFLGDREETYPYDTAARMVLSSVREWAPGFRQGCRVMLRRSHVQTVSPDGNPNPNECLIGSRDLLPWLQVNYSGSANSPGSLAHEFGHAVHYMAASDLPELVWHPVDPIAEILSILSELIAGDKWRETLADPGHSTDTLLHELRDVMINAFNGAFRTLFEVRAHAAARAGASLDELTEIYLETLQELFGDAVSGYSAWPWRWLGEASIISQPFIGYSYTFGALCALHFLSRLRESPEATRGQVSDLMRAGGSMSPRDMLVMAGVDPTTGDVWRSGFEEIERRLDEISREPS